MPISVETQVVLKAAAKANYTVGYNWVYAPPTTKCTVVTCKGIVKGGYLCVQLPGIDGHPTQTFWCGDCGDKWCGNPRPTAAALTKVEADSMAPQDCYL